MNKLYAIIGPPASGKTTIVKQLFENYGIPALVSHTTRLPKKNEENGKDYYFVSKADFATIQHIEKANYSGDSYGLSKDEVLNKIKLHPVSVVDIDATGYNQLKKLLSGHLESIYILVDKDEIISRYLAQEKSAEDIKVLLEYAEANGEFNNWQIADHVVKNTGSIEVTMRQIVAILDLANSSHKTCAMEGKEPAE
ncbi:guanylate kinase [Sporomusaceae bacterium BoRhaA]|uniref:guanylate kinase n=1 Tax=Pelorhabdus rhamnosifermentans TaxID=2772457 RepID=UPI001C05F18B|nr:guanylate kinase [Pelorhabdus rhamnosifermentans]MBU2700498.1 guanylate kinase [Pelorhabdus rhamnosifermentans]